MAVTSKALAVLLITCIAWQATASGAHPELLRFFRQPAPSILDDEAGLGQTPGRRLQQTFESPDLPFTFDGYGFGYGGIFPGGGAFNNFAVNIYNILFRDIFNEGLNQYIARIIPNSLPDTANFVPPEIGQYFTRPVVELFGFDFFDRYIGQYYTFATATLGELVDAGCTGPVYSLNVDGGACEIMDDGSVECTPPSITLTAEPTVCNLPYRSAASLEGAGWQYVARFGRERSGNIGPPPGEYNFGAAVNITAPYIGFSFQLQRLANDFGVQQWYQFVGNLVLGELLRIQRALLDTTVDDNLATEFGTTGRRLSQVSSNGFGRNLISRIAERMGMDPLSLSKSLQALNAYSGPLISDVVPSLSKTDSKVESAAGKQDNDKPANSTHQAASKPADTKPAKEKPEEDKLNKKKPEAKKPAVTKPEGAKVPADKAPKAPSGKSPDKQADKKPDAGKPQAGKPEVVKADVAQGKKVVRSTDESEGDGDLLSQLDVAMQQMAAKVQNSVADAIKKGH